MKNNEQELFGKKHVFYNNTNSRLLFISFAGIVKRYVSVTWFYNKELEGNFLFLKDDENNFSTYNDIRYDKIILHYLQTYNIEKIVMYGASMGGMAAIDYGLKFQADLVIAIDPQLISYNINNILEKIRCYGNTEKHPKFYINYTFTKIDEQKVIPRDTKQIIDSLSTRFITFLHPYPSFKHIAFIPSKTYLINIINMFLNLNITNYNSDDIINWF